jgi:putative PIN family toxin of toxin-antitoxin system
MRVVLDTNVVVSRLLSPHGFPARIFRSWQDEAFEVLLSAAALAEYERVLRYPRLRKRHSLSDEGIAGIVRGFRSAAVVVEPRGLPDVVKDDPSDNVFLAIAAAGRASYVVSGDRHLLSLGEYRGIRIVSPAAFVALLERGS